MTNSKVFVLGIDAATFDLIEPWVREGKLPSFREMTQRGAFARMPSTVPVESATAWSSMLTGTNPGKHGVFAFSNRKPGTYDLSSVNFNDVKTKTLFELLSDAGKRVVGVSIPLMYPAPKVNGLLVSGLLSPMDRLSGFPEDEIMELNMKFNSPRIQIDISNALDSPSEFVAQCKDRTDTLLEMTHHLIRTKTWDFFMVVTGVIDETQHFFWGDMLRRGKYGKVVLEMYQRLDSFLGELTKTLSPDTHLIVVSDHGQGPMSELFCVNVFLEKNGYLRFRPSTKAFLKRSIYATSKSLGVERFALSLSRRFLSERNSANDGDERSSVDAGLSRIDWGRTKAYSFSRGVCVNLEGREPQGTVTKETYEHVRGELVQRLKDLKASDGRPILDLVATREEAYTGKMLERAPDVIIESDRYTIYGPAGLGRDVAFNSILERSTLQANHRRDGVFLVAGPGVRGGHDLGSVSILDVAPTILSLLDVPIPEVLDGKPIPEAFTEEYYKQHSPNFTENYTEKEQGSYEWSKEDEERIRENLRALGYV